jgi:hypothetical protein
MICLRCGANYHIVCLTPNNPGTYVDCASCVYNASCLDCESQHSCPISVNDDGTPEVTPELKWSLAT